MKNHSLRWLACLALLLSAIAAQAKTTLLVPGRGFGNIELGATYQDFAPALGKPKRVSPSTEDPSIKMVFFDKFAVQCNGDGKVLGITVMSPDYRTSDGIGVGTGQAAIEKAYGVGLQRGEGNLTYPKRGIGFMFRGGQAAFVLIFKAEEGPATPLLGDRLLIGGQRAGDLRLGMPLSKIEAAWGQPTASKDMGNGRKLVEFKKEGVRFVLNGGAVEAILITTGDFISKSGVKVGSHRADIEKVLGPAPSHKGDGIFYPKVGVGFLLAQGEVREIQILAPSK